MNLHKVYDVSLVLIKSQLRAGRSGQFGAGFFRKPISLLEVDAAVFALFAAVGQMIVGFASLVPGQAPALIAGLRQGMVFLPALIPSMILAAGVLFELSVSSKFASSDSVNWLPVTQAEYVAASAFSVSYNYSVLAAVLLGVTFTLSVGFGMLSLWLAVSAFSLLSLFLGGTLVEILRAAVNRVSSAVFRRARRGALILRLVITVAIILAFQLLFNFVFTLVIINSFTAIIAVTPYIPVFWASLATRAVIEGNLQRLILFTSGTLAFDLFMLWLAIKVRARYWSPYPTTVKVTYSAYSPRAGLLRTLGFSVGESALVRKDLKGFFRRRELLQYFAIPVVLAIVVPLQAVAVGPNGGEAGISQAQLIFPVLLVGGIFALLVGSISFGQEGPAVINLYSLPLTPKELLRAKAASTLVLSLVASFAILTVSSFLTGFNSGTFLLSAIVALLVTFEETFIGLGFGTRFPDFQERPRPRFMEPIGILFAMLVGMACMFATALPVFLLGIAGSLQVDVGISTQVVVASSVAFAVAVTVLAYRWTSSGAKKLLTEFRT